MRQRVIAYARCICTHIFGCYLHPTPYSNLSTHILGICRRSHCICKDLIQGKRNRGIGTPEYALVRARYVKGIELQAKQSAYAHMPHMLAYSGPFAVRTRTSTLAIRIAGQSNSQLCVSQKSVRRRPALRKCATEQEPNRADMD